MIGKGLSVATVPFYPCGDRFVPSGYRKDPFTFEQKLEKVAAVGDVKGVELSFPAEFEDPLPVKAKLASLGLTPTNMEVELFGSAKWKYGALSATDDSIRREAIALSCRCMDAAAAMGCAQISLWPGQDGWDYPFQVDYAEVWARTIDAIREIAAHRPAVKVALEYKIKEPRTHILLATVCKTLLAIHQAGQANVGVMIDFGHSLMALENPAEAAVLAHTYGKLLHVHLNDNYRGWDDDMIVGSVHLWETFEFFYALRTLGYDGWLSLDVFPYREESVSSMRSSLDMVKRLVAAAERADRAQIAELQKRNDAVGATAYLRDLLLQ
jgi:xylose isomerase